MNSAAKTYTGPLPGKQKLVTRSPKLSNAVFGMLFLLSASLTGLGALYALSGNNGEAASALPALQINLILILILGVFLVFMLRRVFFTNNAERSAPHLHQRFILIFSMSALLPAILVGLFFSALMSRNINDVFGPSVRETMDVSGQMSTEYLKGETADLGERVYDVAYELNLRESQLNDRISYTSVLISLAVIRQFPALFIIDGEGRILAKAEGPEAPEYIVPSANAFKFARDEGKLTYGERAEVDLLTALYKLENYDDAYLYTGRYVREGMLSNITSIAGILKNLEGYSGNVDDLNRVFFLTYVEVAMLIFFASIWVGLMLANRIVSPLGQMVGAAEKVRSGDLTTRVNVVGVWDEISDLANAFNRMTRQLHTQRQDLIREHDVSEQRREFSEAVLSGVSAGVIGLSPKGRITIINRSAEVLLGFANREVTGQLLESVLKEFLPVFKEARDNLGHQADDQVNLETPNGLRNLDIRVSAYKGDQADTGWVVTFDDMTRLVAAQRHSAWRDVARRIAHEIKNPLTPIMLSAERLQRKYGKEIINEPDVFENCTKTIIRQVDNLGRMVDEFSAFARMPAPILQDVALNELMEQTLFAERVAFPEIEFTYQAARSALVLCDSRLISQALTNVYKNAGESITRRLQAEGGEDMDGAIETKISFKDDLVVIDIIDNGEGWPVPDKDRLLEPYMTTREKGTGLGLAIVKRIVEDHGGVLTLVSLAGGNRGAHVKISLPIVDETGAQAIPKAHRISGAKQDILS